MNLIKSIITLSLIGSAIPLAAKPIKIQCSDTLLSYDDQTLKILKSNTIESEISKNQYWNGNQYILNDNVTIKLPIDSKGFTFMMFLAAKTNEQIFNFIDSLDEQTFRLVSFYTQILKETRISDLLKYKMIKNPMLQQLAEMPDNVIQDFVFRKSYLQYNYKTEHQDTLFDKYLNKRVDNDCINYNKCVADAAYAFLVLIDFYQETLKKPLPLNTDHLKNLFLF